MSTPTLLNAPVPFVASMETIADDEQHTIDSMSETLLKISQTVYEDSGHAMRSVHAKSHGLIEGTLTVLDDLPPALAQGIFRSPVSYRGLMRLSTPPGDVLPDDVSTPRGAALKLFDVPGTRLPGSAGEASQDFVLINAPAFSTKDAKHFLGNLKLLAATTDKGEGLKQLLSAVLRGTERLVEKTGHKSATLTSLGGHPMSHILGETFFSAAALLYGPYIAKIALAPVSENLQALTHTLLDLRKHPDGLREAVSTFFASQGGEWELRAQLCTNAETMPVEDASVLWSEEESPYVAVARFSAPPQTTWNAATSPAQEDGLSFSPWHGVAEHRPLGSIMRARKDVYQASAGFRGSRNGCPIHAG
ncbi:MAG: catalase [Verrucomicrobiaceae bacterium]|nr:catalase [Verrucomicrobiaceae bacterium]